MSRRIHSLKESIKEYKEAYRSGSMFKLLILSILLGVIAGGVAALFFLGIESCRFFLIHHLAGIQSPSPTGERLFEGTGGVYRPWLIPCFTTLVGLVTGFLVEKFIPETKKEPATDGTDFMTRTFHYKKGIMRMLVVFIRGITSILTIGSGGSAGREGPITQIGAGLGSWLSRKFNLSPKERRILLLAGAGGGLGAIFRAPLGGAITAVEIVYTEDFETEALLPAVMSSVLAYTVFTLIYGHQPMFDIPMFSFNPKEFLIYVMLGLFCSLTGYFYVKTFFSIKYKIFQPITQRYGLIVSVGLGGLFMGILGMFFPQLLSGGYGWLEEAIKGHITVLAMFLILIGKTIATSITLGSGMSGGMFAPALFVGGMSGGIVGFLGKQFFSDIVTQPGSYVLVGMAAFFSGIGRAPVGPLIMVCELTRGYGLLAPLMLCSAICIFFNRGISIYENQVENKFKSPAHTGEFFVDVLQSYKVADLLPQVRKVQTVPEDMKFSEFKRLFCNTQQHYFPVVDDNNKLTGIFSTSDFRGILLDPVVEDLIIVKDIAIPDIIYTTPSEDLRSVLAKFTQKNIDELPVVDEKDHKKLMGMLRRREVIAFYNEQVKKIRES